MCKCGHWLWDHDYYKYEKCTLCPCQAYNDDPSKVKKEQDK